EAESDESPREMEILCHGKNAKRGSKFEKANSMMPKSILKTTNKLADDSEASDKSDKSELRRDSFARPAPSTMSRGVRDRLAQDDAEIEGLEKALGIKGKKKLPKSFLDDGLDELLGDLGSDSGSEARKRKREGTEWLQRKRRKAQGWESDDSLDEGDVSDA